VLHRSRGRIDGLGLGETWWPPGFGQLTCLSSGRKNRRGKNDLGMDVRLNKADAFTSALSDKAPIVFGSRGQLRSGRHMQDGSGYPYMSIAPRWQPPKPTPDPKAHHDGRGPDMDETVLAIEAERAVSGLD
jgi:hypothetical protein